MTDRSSPSSNSPAKTPAQKARRLAESKIKDITTDEIIEAIERLGLEVAIQGTHHIEVRPYGVTDETSWFCAEVWVDSEGLKYCRKWGNANRASFYRPSVRQIIRRLTGVIPKI